MSHFRMDMFGLVREACQMDKGQATDAIDATDASVITGSVSNLPFP